MAGSASEALQKIIQNFQTAPGREVRGLFSAVYRLPGPPGPLPPGPLEGPPGPFPGPGFRGPAEFLPGPAGRGGSRRGPGTGVCRAGGGGAGRLGGGGGAARRGAGGGGDRKLLRRWGGRRGGRGASQLLGGGGVIHRSMRRTRLATDSTARVRATSPSRSPSSSNTRREADPRST